METLDEITEKKNEIIIEKLIAIIVIVLNLYFVKMTILNIIYGEGSHGFDRLISPITVSYHLFIPTALIQLFRKKISNLLFVINCLGLTWLLVGIVLNSWI
jgi:hypothetical protein